MHGHGHGGQDDKTWADHTDVRPTMLSLLGLKDSYVHDGRVLIEVLDERALPVGLRRHEDTLRELGEAYKQINAPFGKLSANGLKISTAALASGDTQDDTVYTMLEDKLMDWTARRETIAGKMREMLDRAAFGGKPIDVSAARHLTHKPETLLHEVRRCAADIDECAQ